MRNSMTFLEAKKALRKVAGRPALPMRLLGSGTLETVSLFCRARFAAEDINLAVETLPFGTLHQHLTTAADGISEVALVLPWDLCGATDWRSGAGYGIAAIEDLLSAAERTATALAERCRGVVVYIDAPAFPVFRNTHEQKRLTSSLRAIAEDRGACILPASFFSMSAYLSSGEPIAGAHLAETADAIYELCRMAGERGGKKVLVTDLDNCLWRGIVGEDGPDNVSADAEDSSFRYFIYQSFLKRLEADGIILAIASRNDADLARQPLSRGNMVLGIDDFAAIEAGYGTKSDALRRISSDLNLGLDSFVFVDDNPIELAEVENELPEVVTVAFPPHDRGLPVLFDRLNNLFHRDSLTEEDHLRSEFYRNRKVFVEQANRSTSVEGFLRGLDMKLEIFSKTPETWSRAIQLINKTNQFNLNGLRWSEEDVRDVLDRGGHLFTAKLSDNTGDHGEIISFLIDNENIVRAFVMSCRVFQRRVENAFLLALSDILPTEFSLAFIDKSAGKDMGSTIRPETSAQGCNA